jgi:hypothetical protein
MHDQPVNQNDSSPTATEQLDQHLDQRIIRALESVPQSPIPADFAARVARQLPARRPASLTATHYGQNAMLLSIGVTLAALLVLALYTTGHAAFGLLESLLFAEFIALAVWFSISRHSLR